MPLLKLKETSINRAFVFTALIAALINWISLKLNVTFANSDWEIVIFFASNLLVLYSMHFVFGYGDSLRA